MIEYHYSDTPASAAAAHIAACLREHLSAGERVLWLLSGGSGLGVATETAQLLAGTDTSKLVISLTDERYGKLGHANENWQQLLDSGFTIKGAKTYRPLHGLDRTATAVAFEKWLKTELKAADYRIGLFGVGADGHTAGIMPGSEAISSGKFVTAFTGEDFGRITMTYLAIMRLDEAVIQAAGSDKKTIVTRLLTNRPSLSDFPASVLHKVPRSALYTDIPIKETT